MGLADDLARIEAQERELTFTSFDEGVAFAIGAEVRRLAQARGLQLVVEVRLWDRQMFYAATPGTTASHAEWVRRKSNCVRRFQRSSYAIGLRHRLEGKIFGQGDGIDLAEFADHGGAFPIKVAGAGVIGAITVSGLPQREDHALVVEALCTTLGKSAAGLALAAE